MSDTEIEQIAAEIEGGRPPMVWFTAAAVGVQAGRSGKVVALGDPADGDFLQVRPTGSKDVLSFSPSEVTMTKPPRAAGPAPKSAAPSKTPNRKDDSPVTQPSTSTSVATPSAHSAAVTAPSKPVAAVSDTDEQAGAKEAAAKAAASGAAAPAAKAAAKTTARKPRATAEVTVTLTGTADGEWTVDVVNGKKRTLRGLAVSSAAVAQAAKVLHPEVADVVAGILEAARGVQQAKVAQLQAELAEARKLLDELSE
ncbi:DUF6319 family protein [Nocardia arizonensis]|uniref:DUF6319 family protein n=1 Tax=Nocardia arizonensis TaxID=1141647 RepID=UPI001EF66158|nr:DUF6319 family protein [Nocardia arizonensis]